MKFNTMRGRGLPCKVPLLRGSCVRTPRQALRRDPEIDKKRQTWVIYAYLYKYALFTQAVGQLGMAMRGLGRNDCVPTFIRRPATNISSNKDGYWRFKKQ